MICCKCNREMLLAKVTFQYMGFYFSAEMPRCPDCGQVYIPEETVRGKMQEVEMELEEK